MKSWFHFENKGSRMWGSDLSGANRSNGLEIDLFGGRTGPHKCRGRHVVDVGIPWCRVDAATANGFKVWGFVVQQLDV